MLRRWARRRHERSQAEYWASIDSLLDPEEQKITTVAARNLWDGPQDGVLFLTNQTLYWGAFLGQGRRTRPMFAQVLSECPSARIGDRGTLDVAVGGKDKGSFASFAPVPGIGATFAEFCQTFAAALEASKSQPSA